MKNNFAKIYNLSAIEGINVMLNSINYKRIHAKSENKAACLTEEEQKTVNEAVVNAKTASDLKNAMAIADGIIAGKSEVKFEGDYEGKSKVYGATFHESRDNAGIRVKVEGKIVLPENAPEGLPKEIDTYVWRNYAIIKDGQVNVESLKVSFDNENAFSKAKACGLVDGEYEEGGIYEIVFEEDGCENEISMDYFQKYMELLKLKAEKKVVDFFRVKEEKESELAVYGDNAEWLRSIGLTDNGYAPLTQKVAGTTEYAYNEIMTKVAKFAIPSMNALLKKKEEGKKLNDGDACLNDYYEKYAEKREDEDFQKSLVTRGKEINAKILQSSYELAVARHNMPKDVAMTEDVNGVSLSIIGKCSTELI